MVKFKLSFIVIFALCNVMCQEFSYAMPMARALICDFGRIADRAQKAWANIKYQKRNQKDEKAANTAAATIKKGFFNHSLIGIFIFDLG